MKKYIFGGLVVFLGLFSWYGYYALHYKHENQEVNLDILREYHDHYNEIVKSDQGSWANPIYRVFHDFNQYFWFRIMRNAGFMRQDLWNGHDFGNLLQRITELQKTKKESGQHISYAFKDGIQLIVLSDLHASFHALVRILEDLYARKIINKELEIIDENYKIIFLGDSINRYSYSLETLFVILHLLDRNPDSIFYLKGEQETKEHWKDYDMKYAIETRSYGYSERSIAHEQELNDFFDHLPKIFEVRSDNNKEACLWFSHGGIVKDRGSFARGKDPRRQSLDDYFKQIKHVRALVRGEDFTRAFLYNQGLILLQPEYGVTTWSVLSASNYIYQAALNILEDSYVQVGIKKPIEESTIALFTRPFRGQERFKEIARYNIVSTQQLDNGEKQKFISDNVSTFGSSVALTKIATDLGSGVRRAVATVFENKNKKGGIGGTFLRSFVLDDRYNPELARENVELFIREGIKYNLVPTGSPTLGSYIDLVKDGKISVLFPMTGTSWFHDKNNKNIIHMRASYKDEVFALVDYLVNAYGAKKFALFYLLGGSKIPDWCHQALEKNGIKTWLDLPFTRVQSDFKREAQKILEMQPDAIGIFAAADQVKEIVRQIGVYNLHGKRLFGYSFLDERSLRTFMEKLGLKMLLAHVVPNPTISDLEIVKQYRAAMDEKRYPYDALSLEGYIATRLLLEALEKVGVDATPQKLMEYFESLKDYDFYGLKLNFNPETRCLAQNVWLEIGPKKWIQMPVEA